MVLVDDCESWRDRTQLIGVLRHTAPSRALVFVNVVHVITAAGVQAAILHCGLDCRAVGNGWLVVSSATGFVGRSRPSGPDVSGSKRAAENDRPVWRWPSWSPWGIGRFRLPDLRAGWLVRRHRRRHCRLWVGWLAGWWADWRSSSSSAQERSRRCSLLPCRRTPRRIRRDSAPHCRSNPSTCSTHRQTCRGSNPDSRRRRRKEECRVDKFHYKHGNPGEKWNELRNFGGFFLRKKGAYWKLILRQAQVVSTKLIVCRAPAHLVTGSVPTDTNAVANRHTPPAVADSSALQTHGYNLTWKKEVLVVYLLPQQAELTTPKHTKISPKQSGTFFGPN